MMRFGNTLADIRRGIVATSVLGLVIGGICASTAIWYQTIAETWPVCVLLTLALPVIFFVGCLPTLAFSIRVEDESVKHVFLDRFVLSNLPAADFERLEWGNRPLPVKIVFNSNRRIHFIGASLAIIGALREALETAKRLANRDRC